MDVLNLWLFLFFVWADMLITDKKIEKKILTAATKGKVAKLRKLLAKLKHWPIECLNEALAKAAAWGYIEVMDELLKHGADINAGAPIGDDTWPPLFYAVENARKEAVCFLLEKGADLNARTSKGWTPLMHSIDLLLDSYNQERMQSEQECRDSDCFEVIMFLIDSGAEINAKNNKGDTALDVAFHYHNPIVIKILEGLGFNRGCHCTQKTK